MNVADKSDKLREAFLICEVHWKRISFARTKVLNFFPLSENNYKSLAPEDLSYFDQLIFRFSKFQDNMGNRLFPALLENLGEDTTGIPFIDLLNKMEQLKLLEDHNEWLELRETRNIVTHEYPFFTPEIIEGLNLLIEQLEVLQKIWKRIETFIRSRFDLAI